MTRLELFVNEIGRSSGVPASWWDHQSQIIEYEFDRKNEGEYSAKYAILGLRLIPRKKQVLYSLEPMYKPDGEDPHPHFWDPGECVRASMRRFLNQHVVPNFPEGFSLGQQVENIHETQERASKCRAFRKQSW